MMAMRRKMIGTFGVFAAMLSLTLPAMAAPAKSDSGANRADIVAAAKKIDEFIQKGYEDHKVKAQPVVNDLVFARRAYLDIVGRNPTAEELNAFLKTKNRKQLVDQLLDSEGYVNHYFNYWADLLRIKTRLNNNVSGRPYIDYVKDFIRSNKGYDKFVYELITAEGRIFDNGAAGYHLRDTGMPLDNMSNTLQVFLGTSIGCAQCHDHPFDKWTQLEFYEISAYTYGLEYRDRGIVNQRELYKAADGQKLPNRVDQILRQIVRYNTAGLHDNTKRQIKLPDDYKYDDAKPGQVVAPMTIFGSEAKIESESTPRAAFGKWVVSKENPRFALNLANRMWRKVFGQGLIEPVGEITDKSKPSHPELMKFLAEQVLAYNFSVKDYLRLLYYTDTYQRGALTADLGPEEVYVFQGRMLKRMSAEQMWDSVVTLAAGNPDDRSEGESGGSSYYDYVDIKGKSASEVVALAKEIAENPQKFRGMQMAGGKGKKGGSSFGNMARAADMPSPANAGHFLREFGQSDRDQLEAANFSPSITQVLNLLNGQIDQVLLDKRSHIMKQLDLMKNPRDKVNYIFMSIVGRPANSGELSIGLSEISRNEQKGAGNLIWALLNTREFMFIQ